MVFYFSLFKSDSVTHMLHDLDPVDREEPYLYDPV